MPYEGHNLDAQRINDFEENSQNYHWRIFWDSIFDHPIVGAKKPYTRFEAWHWIIHNTWREEKKTSKLITMGTGERSIKFGYGQLIGSDRFLSKAWGWSGTKVRTFLKSLESDSMIVQNQKQQINVITIRNFYEYQNPTNIKKSSREAAEKQTTTGKQVNRVL